MGFCARRALIGHDSEAIHQHYVSIGFEAIPLTHFQTCCRTPYRPALL